MYKKLKQTCFIFVDCAAYWKSKKPPYLLLPKYTWVTDVET